MSLLLLQANYNTVTYSLVPSPEAAFFFIEKDPATGAGQIFLLQSLTTDNTRRVLYEVTFPPTLLLSVMISLNRLGHIWI